MPTVHYRVCYRTVEEEQPCVGYREVYHTVMKECRSVCYKPVYEQHVCEQHYTVCKPVYEDFDVCRNTPSATRCTSSTSPSAATRSASRSTQEYCVPVHYCTYRPVYEQHVAQRCYTVCKPVLPGIPGSGQLLHLPAGVRAARHAALLHGLPPVYQDYQVPVHYTTYKPVYEQHVAQRCYTVCHPVYQEYEVPVHYTTCKPVYEQHTCEVPETCYRTVSEQRHVLLQDLHLRAGVRGEVRQGLHRLLRDGANLLPRPGGAQVLPAARPLRLRPLHLHSHYCPGQTVTYEVQCPGHYECRKVWVPHEEVRTVRDAITLPRNRSTPAATRSAIWSRTRSCGSAATPPAG